MADILESLVLQKNFMITLGATGTAFQTGYHMLKAMSLKISPCQDSLTRM